MKRLLAVATVTVIASLAFQFPASATNPRYYFQGKTAQGLKNFFIVEYRHGVPRFEPFYTNFTITCNGQSFNYGWFFIGFHIKIRGNGSFDINLPSDSTPFDWHGTLNGTRATGVQSQGYAAYGNGGGLVDCGTGPVKWKANGVAGSEPAGRVAGSWIVTVTKHPDGHITETYQHS